MVVKGQNLEMKKALIPVSIESRGAHGLHAAKQAAASSFSTPNATVALSTWVCSWSKEPEIGHITWEVQHQLEEEHTLHSLHPHQASLAGLNATKGMVQNGTQRILCSKQARGHFCSTQ
jgi:hypothetical protein